MIYLDTSALVKLVIAEAESVALAEALDGAQEEPVASSAIASVELQRAVLRRGASGAVGLRAEAVLAEIDLVRLDHGVIRLAGRLQPPRLRSLDAIHLASALLLEGKPSTFISYDERLNEAARSSDLAVSSPGRR